MQNTKENPGAVGTGVSTSRSVRQNSGTNKRPAAPRQVYVLRLHSPRGDDIRRLRWLLKALLRRHELRCLIVEEERP
jgi:hypothetical protein